MTKYFRYIILVLLSIIVIYNCCDNSIKVMKIEGLSVLSQEDKVVVQFFQKGYPNAFESEHILNEEEIIRLKNIIISSEFKIVNEQAVKIDTIDKYFIEITETDMDKTYNILIVGDKYLYCFGDKYGWIEVKNSDFIDYLKELV